MEEFDILIVSVVITSILALIRWAIINHMKRQDKELHYSKYMHDLELNNKEE